MENLTDSLRWVFFVLIGFIAGVTAKDIRSGKVSSMVIAIIGACAGGGILSWSRYAGSLLWRMGIGDYELIVALIMSALGAMFALFLFHLMKTD